MNYSQTTIEKTALLLRRLWMERMGLSLDEIAEGCDPARHPPDLLHELKVLMTSFENDKYDF